MTPEEQLVELLMQHHYHICCAESCTGGLLAAAIINVPNASCVLDVSYITYANEAKISCLGVSGKSIDSFGVVSEQVAGEMAAGAALKNHAQVGVATSGIAGPGGGSDATPVGTVCFGFYVNGRLTTSTVHFGNPGRNEVRRQSVAYALNTLCALLSPSGD